MDRIWQWAWDRYGPRYSWAICAISLPSVLLAYVSWSLAIVTLTDRAIVVLDVSIWSQSRPTRLRLRRPRNFYFGRLPGLRGQFVLDNTKYWVPMWFHKDVAAADAALTQMSP